MQNISIKADDHFLKWDFCITLKRKQTNVSKKMNFGLEL